MTRGTHTQFGWRRLSSLWALPSIGATILAIFGVSGAAHAGTDRVTWNGTVSRILESHCVSCHSAAGGARPRLDDYEKAGRVSAEIKEAVVTRRMPPWRRSDFPSRRRGAAAIGERVDSADGLLRGSA